MNKTTREQILSSAAELFAHNGFHGVGMRTIGEAVGMRGASLYHHFSSKSEILYAIVSASTTDFILKNLPGFLAETNVRDALHGLLRRHIVYFYEHRIEQAVTLRELATFRTIDEKRYSEVQAHRRRYQRAIAERIAFAVADGQIVPIDPHFASYSILGMVNGINDWFRSTGGKTIEEVADIYCDFVVNRLLSSTRA